MLRLKERGCPAPISYLVAIMKVYVLLLLLVVVIADDSHPLYHPDGSPKYHHPFLYGKNSIRFNMGINAFRTMIHGGAGGYGGHHHFGGHGGAVYVRWGHTGCPSHTNTLYSGFVGGTYYAYGGGAESLCLHPSPTLSTDRRSFKLKSYLYGAEYEVTYPNGHAYPQNNYDIPCAVCQAWHGSNAIMIPGRDRCPRHFHREYRGILMSEYYGHTHSRSQFMCVDIQMKVESGSSTNYDGKLFYPVVAVCGSLNCPPYKSGEKISCAVCTN